jgi:hypothetical protein
MTVISMRIKVKPKQEKVSPEVYAYLHSKSVMMHLARQVSKVNDDARRMVEFVEQRNAVPTEKGQLCSEKV